MNQLNTKIAEQCIKNVYDPEKAIEYGIKNYNNNIGLCAEFASNCLQAGGIDMPTIIWVPALKNYLEKRDFEEIQDEKTGPKGAVVIYYANKDGSKWKSPSGMHAAISCGDGKIVAHNNPKKCENGVFGKRWILVEKK